MKKNNNTKTIKNPKKNFFKKIKKFESACRPLRSAASLPIPDQSNPIQSNLIQPCLLYHRSIRVIPGTRTKKTVYVACCAWRPRALRVPP